MRIRTAMICCAISVALLTISCDRTPEIPLAEAANSVAATVGKVQTINEQGNRGPIFVFEENHASKAGQVQIATMLLRLHDHYQLKTVGLEGAIQAAKPLDATWFSSVGTDPKAREDVGVQMLSDGQISAPEFITMLYPDVAVHGLEVESEYAQGGASGGGELSYLLLIALQKMDDNDAQKLKKLLDGGKISEALEFLSASDPWVKVQVDALRSPDIKPIEEEISRANAIKQRAEQMGIAIPQQYKNAMDSTIRFYETASQRSVTMVNRVLSLPGVTRHVPVAMIIGAGHTTKIVDGLKQNGAKYVVLRPLALDAGGASLTAQDFALKEAGKWVGQGPGSLARILNSKHKPPPVVAKRSAPAYASMNYAAYVLAKAEASGDVNQAVSKLGSLPGVVIDPTSIQSVPGTHDVIFSATVQDDHGNTKQVWARAGALNTAEEAKTLEEKLLSANRLLTEAGSGGSGKGGGGGKVAVEGADPSDPNKKGPKKGNGDGAGDGGKDGGGGKDSGGSDGDGSKGDHGPAIGAEGRERNVEYNRAAVNTLVIFSERKEDVVKHAALSQM